MAGKRGFASLRNLLDFPREPQPWIAPIFRGVFVLLLGGFAPWNLPDFRGLQERCCAATDRISAATDDHMRVVSVALSPFPS